MLSGQVLTKCPTRPDTQGAPRGGCSHASQASIELRAQCLTGFLSGEGKEWLCSTCDRCSKTGKMICQAQANGLAVEDIPDEFATLFTLEARMISQRIPFMKLVTLPRGGQQGIRGSVMNVSTDLTHACTILPRKIMQMGLIGLEVKKKAQLHRPCNA